MNQENALAKARENGILIATHRGVAGGNIPCNTIAAFEAALRQGADILEADLAPSGDGQLLIFHPKCGSVLSMAIGFTSSSQVSPFTENDD